MNQSSTGILSVSFSSTIGTSEDCIIFTFKHILHSKSSIKYLRTYLHILHLQLLLQDRFCVDGFMCLNSFGGRLRILVQQFVTITRGKRLR
jgi:hypothetical protein